MATVLRRRRRWAGGAVLVLASATIAVASPVRGGRAAATRELAGIEGMFAKGQFREAERVLVRLRARADLTMGQRAHLLARLAGAQVELGRYEQALLTADEAESAARGEGTEADEPRIRTEIARGSAWSFRGFPYRGAEHHERALALAERAKRDDLTALVLSMLSTTYGMLGDWSRTLHYAERAFQARTEPSDHDRFLHHAHRGIAFYEFGDRGRAEEAFRSALELARRTGRRRDESWALGELGLVAWLFDRDHTRALDLFERARSLAREIGVLLLEVSWMNNAAGVLRDSGDLPSALARYREALAIEEAAGQRRERPALLKNIGQVLSAMGRHGEAEPFLLDAVAQAEAQGAAKIRWMARMELGGAYRGLGDAARADRFFAESLEALEASQSSVLLEGFRVGLLGRALEQYDPYDRYIEFLLERGDAAGAFAVAERARARVFLETLAGARAALAAATPRAYLDAETELLQRISRRQQQLRAADLPPAPRREAVADVAAAEDALEALRLRLAVERPALAQARFPRLRSLGEVQRDMPADEVLALFFLGRRASAAWVVDRGHAQVVPLPARGEIERAVRRLLPTLQSPQASVDEDARSWLSRTLLAPVLVRVPEGAHLVVVPHAVLIYLPLEVLADERGRYLVERNTVSYAPSASSLAFLRASEPKPRPSPAVIAVGAPATRAPGEARERGDPLEWVGLLKSLPHSRTEIRRVAAAFRPHGQFLEGDAATEPALRAAAGQAVILHFATHALIDEERPERSGLALSPGPEDSDGILQTREVYELDLEAALVTLSACQTALGREVTGEGLVGLSRAFFYAGAAAVTASLWNVNDRSSADLMSRFYDAIRAGASIERALADAKRSFLRAGPTRHPYYWAPFVVTGHARQTVHFPAVPPSRLLRLGLAVAAVAAAALTVALRRRKRTGPARA
jgi:CHAT domain-containing protein